MSTMSTMQRLNDAIGTMESDSDSSSSRDDSSFVDDDESMEISVSSEDDAFESPLQEFGDLLAQLLEHRDESDILLDGGLRFQRTEMIRILLERIDGFCECLQPSMNISRVSLGDGEGLDWPQLQMNEESKDAWNKLCRAIGSLDRVHTLKLGGYNLSGEIMAELVQGMAAVEELEIRVPWFGLMGDDARVLFQALSNHQCQSISIEITGNFPDAARDAVIRNGGVAFEEIFAELLLLDGLKKVSLQNLDLSLDECKEIANKLSSNACKANTLCIDYCSFEDQGGQIIANAFRSNTNLKALNLTEVLANQTFRNALFESLPANESIESFNNTSLSEECDLRTIIESVKHIARQNTTLKAIRFYRPRFSPVLDKRQTQELQDALQENYSLEEVLIGGEYPCATITLLNQAGRRYLGDDQHAEPKAACIQVLSNPIVNDNLDCLYFHLRENPVLFTGRTGV